MTAPLALITGGQQGIGLGIARCLAAAGWQLVLAAELPPDAGAVQEALADLGPAARYLRHDLADVAAIPALLAATGPLAGGRSQLRVGASVTNNTPAHPDYTDILTFIATATY